MIHEKIKDDVAAFLQSKAWPLLKYRLELYKARLNEQLSGFVRNQDWHAAARLQGMVDAVTEVVKITERLATEVEDKTLDVDAALSVIEKNIGY